MHTDILPIRIKTARIVQYGYVFISGAGILLHFALAWLNNLAVIWVYQALMAVIMGAGLLAIRRLNRSLSQAMWLNTWVDTICVGGMVIYLLESTTQSLSIVYMFHGAILALSLILGFKAATRYATIVTLFLLFIGVHYHELGIILGFIFLAYAIALPAKLVELMIEESKTQLLAINAELRAENAARRRVEAELRMHRDQLDQLVQERTADLCEANAQLKQEITERRQAEAKLRDSEGELRALFTAMRDVVIVLDNEGRYLRIAPASPHLLYRPAAELLGKTVHEVFPRAAADEFLTAIRRSLDINGAVNIEYSLTIQGTEFCFDALISPVSADAVILVARDISERKQMEQALHQRNHELAALNEIIAMLTSTLALDQVLQRIVDTTPQFFPQITCVTIQVKGESDNLYTKFASSHAISAPESAALPPGAGIAGTALLERQTINVPDVRDDPRYVQGLHSAACRALLAAPLLIRDEVLGSLSITATEVGAFTATDERMIETLAGYAAVAVHNARLYEQTMRDAHTKAVLLQEVNHRVKNNLMAVVGMLYTEKSYASLPEHRASRDIIDKLIDRVQGLAAVHRLLSDTEWAPILVCDLVDIIADSLLGTLPAPKRVILEMPPSPLCVDAKHANSLALVVNELLTNVLKYTLHGRNVARVVVTVAADGEMICCVFRDDGPGYPADVLSFKRHNVGYYLVRSIIERQLRGSVALHNDNGAVTTIRFRATDSKPAGKEEKP